MKHLAAVGCRAAESPGGYIDERGPASDAYRFFAGLPSAGFPRRRWIERPLGAPRSNALLTLLLVSLQDQVIANVETNRQRGSAYFLDTGDLKFRGFHTGDWSQPSPNLVQEPLPPGRQMAAKA